MDLPRQGLWWAFGSNPVQNRFFVVFGVSLENVVDSCVVLLFLVRFVKFCVIWVLVAVWLCFLRFCFGYGKVKENLEAPQTPRPPELQPLCVRSFTPAPAPEPQPSSLPR